MPATPMSPGGTNEQDAGVEPGNVKRETLVRASRKIGLVQRAKVQT